MDLKILLMPNSHGTLPNWTLKNACVVDVSIFFDELRRSQAPWASSRPACLPNTPPTMYLHVVGVIRKTTSRYRSQDSDKIKRQKYYFQKKHAPMLLGLNK